MPACEPDVERLKNASAARVLSVLTIALLLAAADAGVVNPIASPAVTSAPTVARTAVRETLCI